MCFVIGIGASSYVRFSMEWLFGIIGGLFFLAISIRKTNAMIFSVVAGILFFLLGMLRFQFSIPMNQKQHMVHQEKLNYPKEAVFTILEEFKSAKKWKSYKVRIHQINKVNAVGNALLKVKNQETSGCKRGEVYTGLFRFNDIHKDTFPYGFNYNNYLLKQNITHLVWASPRDLILLPKQGNKWIKFLGKFQFEINKSLKKLNLDDKVLQLTQALVLGNKKDLDKTLSDDFSKAGVIHVLAISGLHIGIIYMVFVWLLGGVFYAYKYRVLRSVLVLLLLWIFVWFSGASASALRATAMFSCFEISRLLFRKQHPLNALFLAVFVLVLINPKIIFGVGFQLSIIAVASIIVGAPKLSELWQPQNKGFTYLWNITCVSLAAQIGLLPLSIYYFHQIPSLFLVANIPIMVCIPLIMGFAMCMVVGSYFLTLPEIVIKWYNFTINLLIDFVHWVASFEKFVFQNVYISTITMLGCYVVLGYLWWWYKESKIGLKYLFLVIIGVISFGFVEGHKKYFQKEIWLLNHHKNTVIVEIASGNINVFAERELSEIDKQYKILPVLKALHIDKVSYDEMKQAYTINHKKLLIVSDSYIPKLTTLTDIVLLCGSPKINLERLIESIRPKQIIIAADNKFYIVDKWKATCKKLDVPYYDVAKKGSLRLDGF